MCMSAAGRFPPSDEALAGQSISSSWEAGDARTARNDIRGDRVRSSTAVVLQSYRAHLGLSRSCSECHGGQRRGHGDENSQEKSSKTNHLYQPRGIKNLAVGTIERTSFMRDRDFSRQ